MGKGKKLLRSLLCLLLSVVLLPLPLASAEGETLTVRFVDPLDTKEYTLAQGEVLTFTPGPEIEGYTFLGWQDAWGNLEKRGSVRIYEDAEYYALYAMALNGSEKHEPYMFLDEHGAFRTEGTMTRREAACFVYDLLQTELVGDGVFTDVQEDDPCYNAVATLKTLGALSGSRFHPDETITRYEFLELLSHFYPAAEKEAVFSDLPESDSAYPIFALAVQQNWIDEGEARPDAELTRLEAVRIFNRIQGRSGDSEHRRELVGTILDVPFRSEGYWEVAEAVIPHEHEDGPGGERWTESEALPIWDEGLFYIGVRLHAVDETGDVVTDGVYQDLYFNERGEVSSGREDLDELIFAVLESQIDPQYMNQLDMLVKLYNYTVVKFSYLGRHHYEFGETGWEAQEAYDILSLGSGNCYSFAAVFYYFARAIGYPAQIYSGKVLGMEGLTPHAWVEIVIDGVNYIFDPEMQCANAGSGEYESFFMRDDYLRRQYGYSRAGDEG